MTAAVNVQDGDLVLFIKRVCYNLFKKTTKHVFGDLQVKKSLDIWSKRFSSLIQTEISQQLLAPLNLVQILKVLRGWILMTSVISWVFI